MGFAIVRHAQGTYEHGREIPTDIGAADVERDGVHGHAPRHLLDLGLRPDFLIQWAKAYFIAWPVAAATAFFIMPSARRLTDRIVALIDGRR